MMRDLPAKEIIEAYHEWLPVMQFFNNVESGFIIVTVGEYNNLPAYVRETWILYKTISERVRQKK